MARYTDIDKLIAEYDRVHVGPAGGARKLMVEAPIADVAPRAEVDKIIHDLEQKRINDIENAVKVGYRAAKQEVAREIFAEIEEVINELGYFDEIDFKSLKKKYTEVQK